MEQLLLELMCRLEVVGDRDESLYDSEVREMMGDPIFYLFVRPTPQYVMSDDFGMPDKENQDIKAALLDYIQGALSIAPDLGLDTFHKRLAAFQNGAVRTVQLNSFDDFFGWMNPDLFDASGNVRRGESG